MTTADHSKSQPPQPISGPIPDEAAQDRMVEAMLFASPEPLSITALRQRMPVGCDPAEAVARLRRHYTGRGMELLRIGDGFAFRTPADLSELLREHVTEIRRLSRATLETLAIIAYHQPTTRAEIEEIRGTATARGTLDQLLSLGWIRMGRRRQTPGRPATFLTTDAFLDHFGLESARDLPGLDELRAAGLLDARPIAGSVPLALSGDSTDIDDEAGPDGDLLES